MICGPLIVCIGFFIACGKPRCTLLLLSTSLHTSLRERAQAAARAAIRGLVRGADLIEIHTRSLACGAPRTGWLPASDGLRAASCVRLV